MIVAMDRKFGEKNHFHLLFIALRLQCLIFNQLFTTTLNYYLNTEKSLILKK